MSLNIRFCLLVALSFLLSCTNRVTPNTSQQGHNTKTKNISRPHLVHQDDSWPLIGHTPMTTPVLPSSRLRSSIAHELRVHQTTSTRFDTIPLPAPGHRPASPEQAITVAPAPLHQGTPSNRLDNQGILSASPSKGPHNISSIPNIPSSTSLLGEEPIDKSPKISTPDFPPEETGKIYIAFSDHSQTLTEKERSKIEDYWSHNKEKPVEILSYGEATTSDVNTQTQSLTFALLRANEITRILLSKGLKYYEIHVTLRPFGRGAWLRPFSG